MLTYAESKVIHTRCIVYSMVPARYIYMSKLASANISLPDMGAVNPLSKACRKMRNASKSLALPVYFRQLSSFYVHIEKYRIVLTDCMSSASR